VKLSQAVATAILSTTAVSCLRDRPEEVEWPTTAFVRVNVVPMTGSDGIFVDQTVVVRGDRIVSIQDANEAQLPVGTRRIEGDGAFLIPGLADMHVHLEYFDDPALLQLFLVFGVTTVRNMDGRPKLLDWREQVRAGTLLGPSIYTAGPLLDGDPPLLADNMVIRNSDEGRAAVVSQDSAGYDFVKVYTNLPRDAYSTVLETARERGRHVVGHVPRTVTLIEAFEGGQRSIEHLGDYSDFIEADNSPLADSWHWSRRFLGMPIDETKVREIADRQRRAGVSTVPTMVQADRELVLPAVADSLLNRPEMEYLPAAAREYWTDLHDRVARRMDASDWELVGVGRSNRQTVVGSLHDAGVSILAGTDTPNPSVIPGVSLHAELRNLREAGLSPQAALAAATSEAARFMGEAHEWGTVASGQRADLVLVAANPLEDTGHAPAITGVMVRGRWLSREQLDTMLASLATASVRLDSARRP